MTVAPLESDRPTESLLLISQVFPPMTGGSGRWLWELYRRLTVGAVQVLAGRVAGSAEFDRTASLPIGRTDLEFPNWGLWHAGSGPKYVRRFLEIWRLVSREHSRSIHCGKCLPEGLLAAGIRRVRGIPFVVFAHGEELMLAKTSRELHMLTQWVLQSAAIIIANSEHTKTLLRNDWRMADGRMVVLNPGVDTSRFVPAPPDSQRRRALGWEGRRVILTAGTLQKRKGQDTMIRALPFIRERFPEVLYSMIGRGVDRDYLDALVAEHRVEAAVQFRGAAQDDELVHCYQQCDLFALPNRQIGWDLEGFGMVLVEAQACGRPVLAGRSGGAPETVHDGVTGVVADCEDPRTLANAVIALLEDPQRGEAMGRAARQWAVERFDWQPLAQRADRVFAAVHAGQPLVH